MYLEEAVHRFGEKAAVAAVDAEVGTSRYCRSCCSETLISPSGHKYAAADFLVDLAKYLDRDIRVHARQDLRSLGEITLFHLVALYEIPKFTVTDRHDRLLVSWVQLMLFIGPRMHT